LAPAAAVTVYLTSKGDAADPAAAVPEVDGDALVGVVGTSLHAIALHAISSAAPKSLHTFMLLLTFRGPRTTRVPCRSHQSCRRRKWPVPKRFRPNATPIRGFSGAMLLPPSLLLSQEVDFC
jgi:hypothetical protein